MTLSGSKPRDFERRIKKRTSVHSHFRDDLDLFVPLTPPEIRLIWIWRICSERAKGQQEF